MEHRIPEISARDLALIVFKRKGSIVAIMAATMVVFFAWLFLIHDDLYQVDAKILVKIGREQAPPPSVMGASPLVIAYRSQDVNSEIEIFESGDSVARVVDELHLDAPVVETPPPGLLARTKYEFKRVSRWTKDLYEEALIRAGLRDRLSRREKTIFGIRRGLAVRPQKDSNVFVASLLMPQRVGSARVLNALLDRYLDLRQQIYHNKELGFFQSAADDSATSLRQAESQLQSFETQGGISELNKQETILLDHIASARAAWQEVQFTRQEFAGRIERLEAELAKPDPNFASVAEFGRDNLQQTIVKELVNLQREREQLRMTELDSGYRIRNNRQQFTALATMLSGNLRTALAETEQQEALRHANYDALQTQLRELHDKQMSWGDLKRRASDTENTYRLYRKKLEEAMADDAMQERQIGNVAVIERASDPLAPSGMSKTMLLSIALCAAVLAALAWVTIAEFFDHRVYTVEQLQRQIATPVFAVIPTGRPLDQESEGARSGGDSRRGNGLSIN